MNIFFEVTCSVRIFCILTTVAIVKGNNTLLKEMESNSTFKPYTKAGLRAPISIHYEVVVIERLTNNQTFSISKICIVEEGYRTIYDTVIKQQQNVIDYRTNITGITRNDLLNGENFYVARSKVQEIISWRILIGFKMGAFLSLMKIRHPDHLIRDTSYFTRTLVNSDENPDIVYLGRHFLNDEFKLTYNTKQKAFIAMKLYKKFQNQWEMYESDRHHFSSIAYGLACETVIGLNKITNKKIKQAVRVSIVDFNCNIVYDRLFKPEHEVINYRSNITGMSKDNFTHSDYLCHSVKKIRSIIKGNILVGHELSHHLKFIGLQHPFPLRRDTSSFRPFLLAIPNKPTPTLRDLSRELLNITIDDQYEDTVQNALTAIKLYSKFKQEWDGEIRSMYQLYHNHKKMQGKHRNVSPLAINYCRVLANSNGHRIKLIARITVVNQNKDCIYDRYLKPQDLSKIVNCYTKTTGITLQDLQNGTSKNRIRQDLIKMFEDRIIIGYNLNYLFSYFRFNVDLWNQRDISLYTDFFSTLNSVQTVYKITRQFLNVKMYRNATSINRATIFMELYSKYKDDWDISIAQMVTNMKSNALSKVIIHKKIGHYMGDPISLQCLSIVEKTWGYIGHNILARIVLTDKEGKCVYDKYVKPHPKRPIIDYRTNITGILPEDLIYGIQYYTVISEVTRIMQNKIIIGEQLYKCVRLLPYKAINYTLIRDINHFSFFKKEYTGFYSLKNVCKNNMGFILKNEIDPVERARALMMIYKKYSEQWENEIQSKTNQNERRLNKVFKTQRPSEISYRPTWRYYSTRKSSVNDL
uniref:Exonuclease domain-containing protein n=1 Tax=Clastoptera arizonana TaxID=38151 RepID=A0A1B6CKY3_9HEMI